MVTFSPTHTVHTNPRRVAFVHDTNIYGGVEILLLHLIKHLDPKRYTPVVLVPGYSDSWRSSPARFIDQVNALSLPVLRLPVKPENQGFGTLTQLQQTQQFFRKEGFDVLHIHTCRPLGARISTIGAWLAHIPVLIRTEHTAPPALSPFSRLSLKPLDWMTDYILTISDANLEDQVRLVHRDRKKLYRFYHGIESDRFQRKCSAREAKQKIGLDPNIPVVGSVGRLSPEKGHTYLIKAAPRILKEYGAVNFLIIGDGPLHEQLQKQSMDLGLSSSVFFLGFQPDILPYLEAIDIGVLPSISEGLPLALFEFMACGIPTITNSLPCFREAISDGENGFIASMDEEESLSDRILKLLRDPDLAIRMGQAAIKRVRGQFSIQRFANDMMNFYDKVIASKTKRYAI